MFQRSPLFTPFYQPTARRFGPLCLDGREISSTLCSSLRFRVRHSPVALRQLRACESGARARLRAVIIPFRKASSLSQRPCRHDGTSKTKNNKKMWRGKPLMHSNVFRRTAHLPGTFLLFYFFVAAHSANICLCYSIIHANASFGERQVLFRHVLDDPFRK